MKTVISSPQAPSAIGPYSQGIRTGDMVYFSGQIPLQADGTMVGGDFRQQVQQVLENIKALLAAAGLDFSHVVKSTVFLTDLAHFPIMNELYGQYFSAPFPARSTIQVAALPKGALVEIEIIAKVS